MVNFMNFETGRQIFQNEIRDWHSHERHQLLYAYEGVMRIEVAGGEWVLPPQRGVWIAKGADHKFTATRRIDFRTIYFDETDINRGTGVFHVPPLVRELIDFIVANGEGEIGQRAALLLLDMVEAAPDVALVIQTLTDPRLQKLQELVENDLSDNSTLPNLSVEVGASPRTITRLFQQEMHMSFNNWRRQLRMHKALELLGAGMPVTQVAFEVGYSSTSSFTFAFGEVLGTPPNAYFGKMSDQPTG